MQKFLELFQEKFVPGLNKFGSNKYMVTLRNGMAIIIPITIVGSMFSIIANFPINGWADMLGDFKIILEIPYRATLWFLAIIVAGSIAYAASEEFEVDSITSVAIATVTFIMSQLNLDGSLNTSNFGAGGVFLAMVIAFFTVKVMEWSKKKGMMIKLPPSIPPMISNSLQAILPGFITIIFFWVVIFIAKFDLNASIQAVLSPLVSGLNTLPGILFVVFLTTLMWMVGVNGENILSGLTVPVFMTMFTENSEAFIAGKEIPNITAYGFYYFGIWFGGGCTIVLALMMVRSKAKTYKSLGKLCFGPCIFGIAEPILFGFPIILNPVMAIPMLLCPLTLLSCTYFLMDLNLIGRVVAIIPFGCPPVISGYLSTGGDIRAALWQVVELVIGFLIYYPFFKIEERKMLLDEAQSECLETVE